MFEVVIDFCLPKKLLLSLSFFFSISFIRFLFPRFFFHGKQKKEVWGGGKCGAAGATHEKRVINSRCRILSSPLMKLSSPHDVAIVVSKVPSFSGGP